MLKITKAAAAFVLCASVLLAATACSKPKEEPMAKKEERPEAEVPVNRQSDATDASSELASQEEDRIESDRLFWKPPVGWVGDLMPFNDGTDQVHLFYLQDWRDGAPGFHPWHLVTTTNLTDYTYEGESIPFGREHEPDLAIGTGSVIKVGDTYHGFYTGHNWKFPSQGKPKEAMMHAVSSDLKTWTKISDNTFIAPEGYEIHDFRDPYVYYHEEAGEYRMLVSARKEGVGGVLAVFASSDLNKWEVREPLQIEAASHFFMLECADIFRMNGKWYLVFSEFNDKKATHYRVSDSLDGPWMLPEDGQSVFDGRAFYAAKTGMLGDHRYLFGWVPTRQMEKDYMKWDWAGNLVVHQLTVREDGTLRVKAPDQMEQFVSKPESLRTVKQIGGVSESNQEWVLDGAASTTGYAGVVFERIPTIAKVTGTFRYDETTQFTGFVAGVSDEPERAYGIQAEPRKQRIRYDAVHGAALTTVDPDVAVSIPLEPNVDYPFTLIIEDDIAVMYLEGFALTTRIYKMPGASWGWYSRGGTTTLKNLQLFTPLE